MCTFKPGDEVVCVSVASFCALPFLADLRLGETYVVSRVGPNPIAEFEPDSPVSVWVFGATNIEENWGDIGFRPERFRKVERKNDSLSIEAFLTIKPGFEEPKRTPAKKRERV